MRFEMPWFLLALFLLPVIYWLRTHLRATPILRFSSIDDIRKLDARWLRWMRRFHQSLLYLALALMVIALARPQAILDDVVEETKGVDIVLALDMSESMAATDFSPSRFDVVKETAVSFIKARMHDRVGVVVFGSDAYTLFPLTFDKSVLERFVQQVSLSAAGRGTAIGMAIATSVNRLSESQAVSKVIVLVTDGVNNMGEIAPLKAADLATSKGIKIYTIGVGSQDRFGRVSFDPEMLRQISERTNGKAFFASDADALSDIYNDIDMLERITISSSMYRQYVDYFPLILRLGVCMLFVFILIDAVIFRRLP